MLLHDIILFVVLQFSAIKGSVAWQILFNAIYVLIFRTTARKRMDLINGSQRINLMVSDRETDRTSSHASVSRMLHARDCCGRVVRIPDWPRVRPWERHVASSVYTPFKQHDFSGSMLECYGSWFFNFING